MGNEYPHGYYIWFIQGDITSGARDLSHFALKEKHKKGKGCLVMIDN